MCYLLFEIKKGDKGIQGHMGERGPTGDAGLDVLIYFSISYLKLVLMLKNKGLSWKRRS